MTPDDTAPAAAAPAHILVLAAHPDLRRSRINRRLLETAREVAAEQPGRVQVHDLYAMYPDFGIDIQAEQAALARAELVVWQYPLHWYGMPPMLKLWLDEVLRQGWAYGDGTQALRGRRLWAVVSTGGAQASYRDGGANGAPLETYFAPCRQLASLCGLHWHAPSVLYGAPQVSDAALGAHAARYAEQLRHGPTPAAMPPTTGSTP